MAAAALHHFSSRFSGPVWWSILQQVLGSEVILVSCLDTLPLSDLSWQDLFGGYFQARESHEWTKRRDPLTQMTQRQEFDMKALKVCGPIKPWQFWKWKLRPCWNSVESKSQFLLVSLLILLRVWKLLNYRNLGKSWLQKFDQNWFEFFKNVAFGSFWILLELPVCATVQHRLDPFC